MLCSVRRLILTVFPINQIQSLISFHFNFALILRVLMTRSSRKRVLQVEGDIWHKAKGATRIVEANGASLPAKWTSSLTHWTSLAQVSESVSQSMRSLLWVGNSSVEPFFLHWEAWMQARTFNVDKVNIGSWVTELGHTLFIHNQPGQVGFWGRARSGREKDSPW